MDIIAEKIGKNTIQVGPLRLEGRAILAPMSGITDIGMRRAAHRFGAPLVVSEMVVSSEYVNRRHEALVRAEGQGIFPHVVQIAGCDPVMMAEAARLVEAAGADVVDINMGCPSKRVNGRLSGSALMRDLDHATSLIEATVAAVKVPVTLKMRLGWDDKSLNAPELAHRAEAAGIALVTVHGRTRVQFYTGKADWRAIRAVRQAISIPLVANGDGTDLEDARSMLAASGADAVMLGRAAVGRPWLIGAIARGLEGEDFVEPPVEARRQAAQDHFESLVASMGAKAGVRHARKHLAAYADHALGAAAATDTRRALIVTSESINEVRSLLASIFLDPACDKAA